MLSVHTVPCVRKVDNIRMILPKCAIGRNCVDMGANCCQLRDNCAHENVKSMCRKTCGLCEEESDFIMISVGDKL